MAIDENYPGMTEAVVTALLLNIFHKTPWTDATDDDERNLALRAAVEVIERLNYEGEKASSSQTYQFPRNDDTTVPTDIHIAILYIAISFLDGRDPDYEIENINIKEQNVGGVRSKHGETVASDHIRAGVISPTAWRHLSPYLRDNNTFGLYKS